MALSDEEKQKIMEEEEYRASVRSDHSSKQEIVIHHKKGHGCLIAFLIIIGFPILLAIVLVAINPSKQFEEADRATQSPQLQTKHGNFTAFNGNVYNFDVAFKENDRKFSASFTPFLKNDDRILATALVEIVKVAYGEDAQIDLEPVLEERNGVNLIRFDADSGYYYFLPIKEDTGEIHSIAFWKE